MRIRFLSLLVLSCITPLTVTSAQITSVAGQNCVSSSLDVPLGSYYGGLAECTVTATCAAVYLFESTLLTSAYSGLACPQHTVENNAYGGWNSVDTINAHAIAIDIVSFGIRGTTYVGETCGVLGSVSFQNEDTSVCDAVLMDPPSDGGGGGGGPIVCIYGYTDDNCDCPANPDNPVNKIECGIPS